MTRTDKVKKDRYFTHTGHSDEAPNHVKKDGFGKGNWGQPGDEVVDMVNDGEIPKTVLQKQARRGSNKSQNEDRLREVQDQ